MFQLKALLTSLALPRHEADPDPAISSEVSKFKSEQQRVNNDYTLAQLAPFLKRFDTDHSEGNFFLFYCVSVIKNERCECNPIKKEKKQ